MTETQKNLPSLGTIVKRLQNEAETPNWDADFINKVLNEIPQEALTHYLTEALGRLVFVYDNERRRATKDAFLSVKPSPTPTKAPGAGTTFTPPISTKQELLRSTYWPEFLRSTISTDTGTKMLGMATAVDLDQAATKLRGHAAAATANAKSYERLKTALVKAGVEKVADLDITVVNKAMSS